MGQTRQEIAGGWKRLYATLNVGDSYGRYRFDLRRRKRNNWRSISSVVVVRHCPGARTIIGL